MSSHATETRGSDRLVLTREEVAQLLAVSPRTVARLVERGELPVVRVGRLIRFRLADLDALLTPENAEARSADRASAEVCPTPPGDHEGP